MKNIIMLTLSACTCLISQAQNTSPEHIKSIVDTAAAVFMSNPSRVGLSAGVFLNGTVFTSHYGSVEKDTGHKPTDSTLYEIGSITKTMTGMLLAQAAVDKKLKLDDDIRQYLPGDNPHLEYNGHPIRLFHLLNHSSGLPFMLPEERYNTPPTAADSRVFDIHTLEKNYTKKEFYKDLKKVEIDTIPGIRLSYSNTAAHVLAHILESIYQSSYEELLAKYVGLPAGMRDIKLTLTETDSARLATGYNGQGQQMPYSLHNISGAAGGVFSTVTDLLKYAQLHMDEDNPVVALTHQPTWGNILYYAMGLNWQMQSRENEHRRIFPSGGTAGFNSFLVIYPDLDLAIVLLSNEADENSQGALAEAAQKIVDSITSGSASPD